ncbi:helix-turn-helix domain-containing protein [Roseiconus lacunae]|uniref:helix-turn-helix domain-containing protein n=1 Tax=Roseiconus lacunae TaxID=2605694 RepID=UPI00308B90F6|nr:helix-turn-helix domain-containing protein [Stieleria sp. HD01]
MKSHPILYTQRKTAEMLGVDEKHVRHLRQSGDLVAIDVSLRTSSRPLIRYTRESIQRFIDRRTINVEKPKPKKTRKDIPQYF